MHSCFTASAQFLSALFLLIPACPSPASRGNDRCPVPPAKCCFLQCSRGCARLQENSRCATPRYWRGRNNASYEQNAHRRGQARCGRESSGGHLILLFRYFQKRKCSLPPSLGLFPHWSMRGMLEPDPLLSWSLQCIEPCSCKLGRRALVMPPFQ